MIQGNIGSLARLSHTELAERAAERIMSCAEPRAVCLDPVGMLSVEPPDEAVPDDILGVFDRRPGLIATYRDIRDNLAAEIAERGGVEAILAKRKEGRRAA